MKNGVGIFVALLVVVALTQKKATNLNQNQNGVSANPGQLTRNPLDGELYYYFDPTAYGNDPASDSIYGAPTTSGTAAGNPFSVASGDGIDGTDPNNIGVTSQGSPIKWQF